jgi:hypothetical protein
VRFLRGPFALLARMAALSCFRVAIGPLRFSRRIPPIKHIGAHFDAVHGFAANATLVDDVGQLTVLSAGRSGELVELQQVFPPRYAGKHRSTDARHSQLQWSAGSGGRFIR